MLAVPSTSTDDEVLVHDVLFDESVDFEPRSQWTAVGFERAKALVPPLHLRDEFPVLRVQFVWTFGEGAPERPHGRAIRLRRGDWCQILSNGRYGYDGGWMYSNTVINVALHPESLSVFETSQPVQRDDHRANLW